MHGLLNVKFMMNLYLTFSYGMRLHSCHARKLDIIDLRVEFSQLVRSAVKRAPFI